MYTYTNSVQNIVCMLEL